MKKLFRKGEAWVTSGSAACIVIGGGLAAGFGLSSVIGVISIGVAVAGVATIAVCMAGNPIGRN